MSWRKVAVMAAKNWFAWLLTSLSVAGGLYAFGVPMPSLLWISLLIGILGPLLRWCVRGEWYRSRFPALSRTTEHRIATFLGWAVFLFFLQVGFFGIVFEGRTVNLWLFLAVAVTAARGQFKQQATV